MGIGRTRCLTYSLEKVQQVLAGLVTDLFRVEGRARRHGQLPIRLRGERDGGGSLLAEPRSAIVARKRERERSELLEPAACL